MFRQNFKNNLKNEIIRNKKFFSNIVTLLSKQLEYQDRLILFEEICKRL